MIELVALLLVIGYASIVTWWVLRRADDDDQ